MKQIDFAGHNETVYGMLEARSAHGTLQRADRLVEREDWPQSKLLVRSDTYLHLSIA